MLVESEFLIETKHSKWEISATPAVCEYHPNDIKRCNHLKTQLLYEDKKRL